MIFILCFYLYIHMHIYEYFFSFCFALVIVIKYIFNAMKTSPKFHNKTIAFAVKIGD